MLLINNEHRQYYGQYYRQYYGHRQHIHGEHLHQYTILYYILQLIFTNISIRFCGKYIKLY